MTDKTISAKEWREQEEFYRKSKVFRDGTTRSNTAFAAGESVAADFCAAEAKKAEQREAGNPIYRQLHSCAFCAAKYQHECSPKPTPTVTAEDLRLFVEFYEGPGNTSTGRVMAALARDYAERKGMGPL